MKDQVLLLAGKQKKIKKIRRKRRQLPTILEEEGEGDDADLDDLVDRTNNLLGDIDENENNVVTEWEFFDNAAEVLELSGDENELEVHFNIYDLNDDGGDFGDEDNFDHSRSKAE